MVPNEVIIVEGRDDTKRLVETFGSNIKTIETNGSAVSRQIQEQIKAASEKFDIIIFTDPDYQGERIRKIVTRIVPQAKQAYLSQEEANSGKNGASLGIEHAQPEAIKKALSNLISPQIENLVAIPMIELVKLRLIGHKDAKSRRKIVSDHFRLGHLNGKQLQKKLSQYNITLEQIQAVLNEKESL